MNKITTMSTENNNNTNCSNSNLAEVDKIDCINTNKASLITELIVSTIMNFRNGNNTLQHAEFDLIKLLFQISKNSHNFLFNTSYRELYIPYHKISYEFEVI